MGLFRKKEIKAPEGLCRCKKILIEKKGVILHYCGYCYTSLDRQEEFAVDRFWTCSRCGAVNLLKHDEVI